MERKGRERATAGEETALAALTSFAREFITSIDMQTGPFRIHMYLLSSIQHLESLAETRDERLREGRKHFVTRGTRERESECTAVDRRLEMQLAARDRVIHHQLEARGRKARGKTTQYSQDGVLGRRASQRRVCDRQQERQSPSDSVEPLQDLLFGDEGDNKQRMQVETFAKHPEIVADEKVVDENMEHLAVDLSSSRVQ